MGVGSVFETGSLIFLCVCVCVRGFWGWNPGHQAWQQVPLHSESVDWQVTVSLVGAADASLAGPGASPDYLPQVWLSLFCCAGLFVLFFVLLVCLIQGFSG